ncbi:hypothetical protein AVEN_90962-1 [Araneus ventricosus]|uniref:Uncharacterized protein n=1 Tax=Araneus ventricosus TaxID=182803 RepID=A0A4Y2UJ87_ARAVE|nr:hypothetical protein AVEN_90962-1 [Araneus ventricosus]
MHESIKGLNGLLVNTSHRQTKFSEHLLHYRERARGWNEWRRLRQSTITIAKPRQVQARHAQRSLTPPKTHGLKKKARTSSLSVKIP